MLSSVIGGMRKSVSCGCRPEDADARRRAPSGSDTVERDRRWGVTWVPWWVAEAAGAALTVILSYCIVSSFHAASGPRSSEPVAVARTHCRAAIAETAMAAYEALLVRGHEGQSIDLRGSLWTQPPMVTLPPRPTLPLSLESPSSLEPPPSSAAPLDFVRPAFSPHTGQAPGPCSLRTFWA